MPPPSAHREFFRRLIRGRAWIMVWFAGFALEPSLASADWVAAWATAPRDELAAVDKNPLAGATLRQVVRLSVGGTQLRLRLSNLFGTTPLILRGVHLALAGPAGTIRPGSDRALTFGGAPAVTLPPGAVAVSDPVAWELLPQTDLAVTLQCQAVPATLTMHHGSRTNSYLVPGDALAAPTLPGATKIEHWYFLGSVDVLPAGPAAAVAVMGDSITDGFGCLTDQNTRWTDALVRRLQARPETARIAVLNLGIGGNRLLRDGLGPNMLGRFERDALGQAGVRWVILQVTINDIGTRLEARKRGEPFASAEEFIAGLGQLATRAHARGVRIYATTITPYTGADFYWSADGEADRRRINDWIRTSGAFDAVIDFEAALCDPARPDRLAAAYDRGDHLHPSLAGYRRLAEAVDLGLFTP